MVAQPRGVLATPHLLVATRHHQARAVHGTHNCLIHPARDWPTHLVGGMVVVQLLKSGPTQVVLVHPQTLHMAVMLTPRAPQQPRGHRTITQQRRTFLDHPLVLAFQRTCTVFQRVYLQGFLS